MGMTPEQLGAMTLADAEALATRLESAARTIRDAMALMGGGPVSGMGAWAQGAPKSIADLPPTQPAAPAQDLVRPSLGPVMTNKGPVALTAEEQARKAALRAERLAELPDNIRALEEASPE
jgi:hypothetical protein